MNKYTNFEELKSYVIKNAKKFRLIDKPLTRESIYKYKDLGIWTCNTEVGVYRAKPLFFIFTQKVLEWNQRQEYGVIIRGKYVQELSEPQEKELYDIIEQKKIKLKLTAERHNQKRNRITGCQAF